MNMNNAQLRIITGTALGALCITLFFLPPIFLAIFIGMVAFYITIIEWPPLFQRNLLFGFCLFPFYPLLPSILLMLLSQPPYRPVLFFLCAVVALFDSASYLVGKQYGTHPIAPKISPNKTWQGLFGGVTITILATVAICFFTGITEQPLLLTLITLPICLTAFAGDLFESWIKRCAGLKDSGSILPGHGGVLDRLDGIFGAVFFVYAIKNYLIFLFAY